MAANRYRLRFTFWLDMLKPDEAAIADQIERLKNDRTFVKTIRDGIRLICDLHQGKLDVLFELFPWVSATLTSQDQPHETASERTLREQLKRLEKLMLQQGEVPLSLRPPAGPKALAVPEFDAPIFDDTDAPDLVLKQDTSTNSARNFLNAMMNLQQ